MQKLWLKYVILLEDSVNCNKSINHSRSVSFFLTCGLHMDYILEAILNSLIDTGIAEQIMDYTITEEFNKILEVQQSKIQDKKRDFHAY